MLEKIKKNPYFTPEQQLAYEHLSDKHRKYVDARGRGYNKKDAYLMAGYKMSQNARQGAFVLESTNKIVKELVSVLISAKNVRELTKEESDINQAIDALAVHDAGSKLNEVIENQDSETARRIQFYRDIITGRIKTVRKTKKKNAMGATISETIEEVSDVETKMKARKELDRILGLNEMIDLGRLQVANLTLNIVDSSKHEEVEDSRNKIVLDPEDVEVIDGEQVLVEETKEEKVKDEKAAEETEVVAE